VKRIIGFCVFLFGTLFAYNWVCAEESSKRVEKVEGGYLYEVPGKETPETYVKYIDTLKEKMKEKKKELEELELQIRGRKMQLGILETKITAIERLRTRLYFRRDFDLYKVKEGDTLWSIAGKDIIYGDSMEWETIYTANRDVITNPHVIYPGQLLIIPRLPEE